MLHTCMWIYSTGYMLGIASNPILHTGRADYMVNLPLTRTRKKKND